MRNKSLPFLVIFLIFLLSSSAAVVAELKSPRVPVLVGTVPPLATAIESSPMPTTNPYSNIELAKYFLNTTIDYDAHALTVYEDIYYPNN